MVVSGSRTDPRREFQNPAARSGPYRWACQYCTIRVDPPDSWYPNLSRIKIERSHRKGAGMVNVVGGIPQREGGVAVRRGLQTTAATAFPVTTNGAAVESEIHVAGQHQWFSFTARAGYSYQIETVLGTASDTIVDLVDTDRSTVLVENDDDDRSNDSYASYIEWTCPADGTYYLVVEHANPVTFAACKESKVRWF